MSFFLFYQATFPQRDFHIQSVSMRILQLFEATSFLIGRSVGKENDILVFKSVD